MTDDRGSGSWPGVSLVSVGITALSKAVHDLEKEVDEAIRRLKSDPPPPDDDDPPPPATPAALAA